MFVGSVPAGCQRFTEKIERIASRALVEHDLDRRVRVDAAVPIVLAVDPDRRKGRRQCAGRHDMRRREIHLAAVEIAHLAGAHVDRSDGEARVPAVQVVEVDQAAKSRLQRVGRIVSGTLDADREMVRPERVRARFEESRHAAHDRVQVGERIAEKGRGPELLERRSTAKAVPEFAQLRHAVLRRVAGDERAVDGADRCSDDPVRRDTAFDQRLVDAGLIGAERAPALQHEHRLLADGVVGGLCAERLRICRRMLVCHRVHGCSPRWVARRRASRPRRSQPALRGF